MMNKSASGDRSTPSIELPKGGGAIQGIGETFEHNSFTGTASWRLPLPLSPGREGFGPDISLNYDSGSGNGPFGLGWQLSIPRISRKTELGLPRYDDRDTFVMSGAEDLVVSVSATGTPETLARGPFRIERMRPRVEGSFARIERWTRTSDGDVHWRATTANNLTSVFGRTAAARIVDPDRPGDVFSWLLEETFDARGNHILYEYAGDADGAGPSAVFEAGRRYGQRYPRRIFYVNLPPGLRDAAGGTVGVARVGSDPSDPSATSSRRYAIEVVFDYGGASGSAAPAAATFERFGASGPPVRPDPFSTCRPGFDLRMLRRCERVLVYHRFAELGGPTLVRSLRFDYLEDAETGISMLRSATVSGHRREGAREIVGAMPPIAFRYGAFRPREQAFRDLSAQGVGLPAPSLQDRSIALVDLFGNGAPDIVQSSPAGWRYWRNLGEGLFDEPRQLAGIPAGIRLDDEGVSLADVDGDGQAELLVASRGLAGYFATDETGAFSRFRRFPTAQPFDSADPNVRLVDLTGDGRADALLLGDKALYWFENRGSDGFASAVRLPRPDGTEGLAAFSFADPAGRVHLADMNGDGLADLVLVHQSRVDYWPNLGYGRFGKRVTMGGVSDPPTLSPAFDPRRILFADLNGTGCADLVYLGVDRTHVWFNRSGNAWSAPVTIQGTPQATSPATVRAVDIFGTGTASLVWSYDFGLFPGPHYKAIDLCGGVKPYLLEELDNGLGTVKRVTYAPSTRFALADVRAGVPPASRLPFPVQVVARIETIDRIGRTRLISSNAYHHGHYDAREREFRGFARVERIDGESLESFAAGIVAAGNERLENYVPPTLTLVWHHTGAYAERGTRLAEVLRREFYAGDPAAPRLPDHEIEEADAPSEAYRALRGAVLRTETYALDGSARAPHPFSVETASFSVRALQVQGSRRHGVFLRTLREQLTITYERVPGDPRIAHTINLAVDAFGNVRRSAALFYPRRVPAEPEQDRTLATFTASEFINTPASLPPTAVQHFVGVPIETRLYEIAHAEQLPRTNGLVTAAALAGLTADLNDFRPLEAQPAGLAKVLREWRRTYFCADGSAAALPAPISATGRLPFGDIEPLGLPFEVCRAVLTPGLRAALYGSMIADAELRDAGYHTSAVVDSSMPAAASGFWWQRGTRLATDPARFHVPARTQDSFGNGASVEYDAYCLALRRTVDALGNTVQADIDYRVLQPVRMVDANGNEARVVFDALGLVAGAARMGKAGEGDTLAGFATDLDAAQVAAFFADPAGTAAQLLGGASTRIVYDLDRARGGGGPAAAATISREVHGSDENGVPSPVQISVAYSDGSGRVIQTKSRAAPGTVGGVGASERWIGSGWTIFNNKGSQVQKFESFFSTTADFEFDAKHGAAVTTFYDSAGRAAAVCHPDGTFAKVLFGAWEQTAWDANDTVLLDPRADPDVAALVARFFASQPAFRTWLRRRLPDPANPPAPAHRTLPQDGAVKAMAHAGTPVRQLLDPAGRAFLSIATDGSHDLRTRTVLDVAGHILSTIDPRGIESFVHRFDMLGSKLRIDGSDAGRRIALLAADRLPVIGFDASGRRIRTTYDALRRPLDTWVSTLTDPAEALAIRTVYGESLGLAAAADNLRARAVLAFDGVGLLRNVRFDFKGNLVETSRQYLADHRRAADWTSDAIAPGTHAFRRRRRFDAIDRLVEDTAPDGTVTTRRYDEGGRLSAIDVAHRGGAGQPIVVAVDYNARGQRERVAYGNGATAIRRYEPETLRLSAMRVSRGSRVLQHLDYVYDPVGNVTSCADDAFDVVFNANQRVEAISRFSYDPFYRLVSATGREHEALGACPGQPYAATFVALQPQPVNNAQALRNWTETYSYDDAGNLLEIRHVAGPHGSWTRRQTVAGASNRLVASDAGCPGETGFIVPHDGNGNVLSLPHLPGLAWNHSNRLERVTLRTAAPGGAGDEAFYGYDAGGARVRKVVERSGVPSHSRLYLDGFELFRDHAPAADPASRETVHVTDDGERLASLEAWSESGRDERRLRLVFSNPIGSTLLELNDQGRTIGYEEYRPYGETAYVAGESQIEAVRKLYRYSGKERDAETGFYDFGARFYCPWMGRWLSCDPAGQAGGLNQYGRERNNPIGFVDRDGLADAPVQQPQITQTPLDVTNVQGTGVQAEGYTKNFSLTRGTTSTPVPNGPHTSYNMVTQFVPEEPGMCGLYETSVTRRGNVFVGTGTNNAVVTPGPLEGNRMLARTRSEQFTALAQLEGVQPRGMYMRIVEPSTVADLAAVPATDVAGRSQALVNSVIGRSTNQSLAAVGLEIDPASVRIQPRSVEGADYVVSAKFRPVAAAPAPAAGGGAPPLAPPPRTGGGALNAARFARVGGIAVMVGLGGLVDTPAYITSDGRIGHHFEDPIMGPHGADVMSDEIAATFGLGPTPPSMSPEAMNQSDPTFMLGVGIGGGAIVGGPAGAIIGGLVALNIFLAVAEP